MHRLLLAPAAAALAAATLLAAAPPPASAAVVRAAVPLLGCTNATGAPRACPDLEHTDFFGPMLCWGPGCAGGQPYDPELARPAVQEWVDPYNPANRGTY